MPITVRRTGTRAAGAERRNGGADARDGDALEEAITGRGHGVGGDAVQRPESEAALGGLLRGLRAGDLECVLLTVAMAAEQNRMPSADPAEEARILAFLARLAEHDAALPPPPGGAGGGPERPPDGADAEDGAPGPG